MKKIKTGNIELKKDEFNPKKAKFRVNMFIDLDLIDEIRKLAEKEHMPYQTWIQRKLRDLVEQRKNLVPLSRKNITKIIDERLAERIDKKFFRRAS